MHKMVLKVRYILQLTLKKKKKAFASSSSNVASSRALPEDNGKLGMGVPGGACPQPALHSAHRLPSSQSLLEKQ